MTTAAGMSLDAVDGAAVGDVTHAMGLGWTVTAVSHQLDPCQPDAVPLQS